MSTNTTTPVADRRFVSLFSGAGGLDQGLSMAGWQAVAAIEMDADAAETHRLNAASHAAGAPPMVIEQMIENVDPAALRVALGMKRGELPLLAGGPPCQPFTTHGLRRSIADARAAGVWPAYFEYVREFQPRALVIENVDGLLSAALRHRPVASRSGRGLSASPEERKGSFLLWVINELAGLGYTTTWGLAEAADYGVPQFRQRALIIGVRGVEPCPLPPRRYGDAGQPPYRTLGEALETVRDLGAIQPLSERKRSVYAQIPAGGNWRSLDPDTQRATMGGAHAASGGKSGWWRRLSLDAPAPTILGMPDHSSTALVHPVELRCLSVSECAVAQSFSPTAVFAGTPRSQYQQIGNAVPPLLGRAIGDQVDKHLSSGRSDLPPVPQWRKSSANRRIGTHGWVVPRPGVGGDVTLNVKVRVDHVWSALEEESGVRVIENRAE